jgi:hypothetical protein
MQISLPKPIFIYYTDLLKIYPNLTSLSGANARYRALKTKLGKEPHQLITVKEFAQYNGIEEELVIEAIRA